VAAASTVAVVIAVLDPDSETERRLTNCARTIARSASALHGLPMGSAKQIRRPARGRRGTPLVRTSDIQFMPQAAEMMSTLGQGFVAAAEILGVEARRHLRDPDPGTTLAWNSFQLAYAHLMILAGACSGQLGRALLPPAARALLEDGARWEWARSQIHQYGATGAALRSLVSEGCDYLSSIRTWLVSDGVPTDRFDALVGQAATLLKAPACETVTPPIEELIRLAVTIQVTAGGRRQG
ncbi:MAG: hypothetical protein ACRDZ8_06780, partial [Acidimicrobiales bacterium]